MVKTVSGHFWAVISRAKTHLTIEAIHVRGLGPDNLPMRSEAFANNLSECEWADLRAAATRSRKCGEPVLRCGYCEGPVYPRESPQGRRHFYHFGTLPASCIWSEATAKNPRSIDAQKFRGQQEGDRHKNLKDLLCRNLSYNKITEKSGIFQERFTKGIEGTGYAFPDVFVNSWVGAPAAFELQLSTTHEADIIRREDFYQKNKYRLIWVISGFESKLARRAFKDIYMRNDGQFLGIDSETITKASKLEEPFFRLYRILPGPSSENFSLRLKTRIVGIQEINWGQEGDRPRSINLDFDRYFDYLITKDTDLVSKREKFYCALAEESEQELRVIWDEVANRYGGARWEDMGEPYDTIKSLGVLASLKTKKICTKTKIEIGNIPSLLNSLLLEPKNRRHWTPALLDVCRSKNICIQQIESVRKKIARNMCEIGENKSLDKVAGQVYNIFFPEGAFRRLDKGTIDEAMDSVII